MAISPLTSIISESLTDQVSSSNGAQGQAAQGFSQVLNDVIANAEDTDAQTKVDAYNLSIGNMDDMHTMMIDMAKADVALQTMVQLRNKVLSAYTEVMSTSL
ncbi:flagellar hook-basal body complex protein FliE [Eubacteriaceae bacterium ES2]|nr:flagellar hook-basal body complex protein FliE [Eubacteriaceae bacterium ES2]